ncbi:MAG: PH domain-containing protein [Anaerolineaceae bacterium]
MENDFYPPRRTGLFVIIPLILLLITASLYLLIKASQYPQAPYSTWSIGLGLVFIISVILLIYRVYTLVTMRYTLARGGLSLRWGLRREVISLPEVIWARPVSDFEVSLPLPLFSLPGSIFGKRQVNGLGAVEFAASDRNQLVLVATRKAYYCISPQDAVAFSQQFERLTELGTPDPWQSSSENFGTLWQRVWQDRAARRLIQVGLVMALLLLALAVILSRLRQSITWVSLEVVSSQRLYLLALLGGFAWVVSLGVGIFFYLKGSMEKTMIYLLWGASSFTSLILAAAMLIMSL